MSHQEDTQTNSTTYQPSPHEIVLGIALSYLSARALHVAADLGIADLLQDGPRSVAELASTTGAHPPSLYRLLHTLAGHGVFAEDDAGSIKQSMRRCVGLHARPTHITTASPAGRGRRIAFVTTRPCRAPHQMITDVGLIGSGHLPRPGEVSLAHHGVLFLDERPEFRRHVLEVLRQPLEESLARI